MTTLLEAAKKALEALEKAAEWSDYGKDDAEFGLRHCCGVADWKPHSKHCRLLPIITALRAAIETTEKQEPVAIVKDGVLTCYDLPKGFTGKLYLHPAPTIPEGWQLVPKEPTAEMSSYMNIGIHYTICERIYKAMLQVAPTIPKEL